MAYELFYAFVTTTTAFEFWAFIIWFTCDVAFVAIALIAAYPQTKRLTIVFRTTVGVVLGVGFLNYLSTLYPDDREQVTAFWTGVVLQFPISWGSLFLLLWKQDTRGHSLEIWYALDCMTEIELRLIQYATGSHGVLDAGQRTVSSIGAISISLRTGRTSLIHGVSG